MSKFSRDMEELGMTEVLDSLSSLPQRAATYVSEQASMFEVSSLEEKLAAFGAAMQAKQTKIEALQQEAEHRLAIEETKRRTAETQREHDMQLAQLEQEKQMNRIKQETEHQLEICRREHEQQLLDVELLLRRKVEFAHLEAQDFRELSKSEYNEQVEKLLVQQQHEIETVLKNSQQKLHAVERTFQHFIVGVVSQKHNNATLLAAAVNGESRLVRECLTNGGDLEYRGENGCTALALACTYGNRAVVELLLERGANKESGNKNNSSPLHLCCMKGYVEITQLLLQNQSNVNAKNLFSKTSLYNAACCGDVKIGKYNTYDCFDRSLHLLHTFILIPSLPSPFLPLSPSMLASLLLDYGADIEAIAEHELGATPLHGAILFNQVDMVKMLVTRGASTDVRQNWGGSTLDVAKVTNQLRDVGTLVVVVVYVFFLFSFFHLNLYDSSQLLVEMGTQATADSTEFCRNINVEKAKEIRDYLIRGDRYNGK